MKKILIIEDNDDNMDLCVLILRNKYEVISAYNGTDGLKKIHDERPDLVLLDLSLPDINGLEIASTVRADEKIKDTPVIALTAHGMDGDREMALDAGCNAYVEKPFEVKHLLSTIAAHI